MKHSGEMARILKANIESHLEDAASGVEEGLFCTLYPRRMPRAPSEQLGKVVRAHTRHGRKFRQAEIVCQIVINKTR
jgi:hypothetical protein